MVGPALSGFTQRGPWTNRENIYAWIKNPSAFMAGNAYVQGLKTKYQSLMSAFPDITPEQINAIIAYLEQVVLSRVVATK